MTASMSKLLSLNKFGVVCNYRVTANLNEYIYIKESLSLGSLNKRVGPLLSIDLRESHIYLFQCNLAKYPARERHRCRGLGCCYKQITTANQCRSILLLIMCRVVLVSIKGWSTVCCIGSLCGRHSPDKRNFHLSGFNFVSNFSRR